MKRSFDFLSRQRLIHRSHLAIRKTSSLLVSTPSTFKFVGDITVVRKGSKGLQDYRIPQYLLVWCVSHLLRLSLPDALYGSPGFRSCHSPLSKSSFDKPLNHHKCLQFSAINVSS